MRLLGWLFRQYGRSGAWPRVRAEHLRREPACIACGRTSNLEVHHIRPYAKFPELELATDNLCTLCGDPCHLVFGHLLNYRTRWNPSVREDAARYMERIRQADK